MAETELTVKAEAGDEALEHQGSVKREDYITATADGQVLNFLVPVYGYHGFGGYPQAFRTLPERLPSFNRFTFFQRRDIVLLATTHFEALWASVLAIATTKAAAWGWEIESKIPLRRKRAHNILTKSTAGVFAGWVPFVSAHLRSFMLTGKAVVEIERETSAYSSRVRALHHLNPLRCLFTDDPETPVLYYDRKGQIHELKYHQVMLFADNLDPTEGEYQLVEAAAERAYSQIGIMAAVDRYLFEKVTGRRALSLEFIQGITRKTMEDAIVSSDHEQERKGAMLYKGVVTVPIPGDVPINRVSIPLAEIPDGFDAPQIRDYATIVYADSAGMDVNDIDPRLATARNLGAGSQTIVLAEKAKGKGLAAWKTQWTNNLNMWVLDDSTTFSFSEENLADEGAAAANSKTRAETRKMQIEMGEISPEESRNLAVDSGDLPPEMLEEDITPGSALEAGRKPVQSPLPTGEPQPPEEGSAPILQQGAQPAGGAAPKQAQEGSQPKKVVQGGQGSAEQSAQQKPEAQKKQPAAAKDYTEFEFSANDAMALGTILRDAGEYHARRKSAGSNGKSAPKSQAESLIEQELDEAIRLAEEQLE